MSTLSNIFISIDFCSLFVLLCCRFVKTKFIHITQGKFNGTKLVAWLPHCLGSNPDIYQQMYNINIKTVDGACRLVATSGGSVLVLTHHCKICATNFKIGYGTRSIRVAFLHHSDVIFGAMACPITSLTIFSEPFIQAQIKQNIKAPSRWPLWGEFTGDRWIPLTKGQ